MFSRPVSAAPTKALPPSGVSVPEVVDTGSPISQSPEIFHENLSCVLPSSFLSTLACFPENSITMIEEDVLTKTSIYNSSVL